MIFPKWVEINHQLGKFWNYPPTQDASHHQEYFIFSRESQPKPSFFSGESPTSRVITQGKPIYNAIYRGFLNSIYYDQLVGAQPRLLFCPKFTPTEVWLAKIRRTVIVLAREAQNFCGAGFDHTSLMATRNPVNSPVEVGSYPLLN